MSTKQNPGPFDDYTDLAADEPYFILRGRRPGDADLVRGWATAQRIGESSSPRADDAYNTADQMETWRESNIKTSDADEVLLSACVEIHKANHDPAFTFANCPEQICALRRKAMADILKQKDPKVKP